MKRNCLLLLVLNLIVACNDKAPESKTEKEDWTLLPFSKVDSVNPVLTPDTTLTFISPILNKEVKWAEKDVFNPASIVHNDTLFLIFRAEDIIGKYAGTSRLGLAYS